MHYLEITDGQGRQRRVSLERPRLLIGREPTCDIHLPHPSVSRRHAQLQRDEHGHWVLQDLSSLNHVFVDGQRVEHLTVEPGKVIRIAEYRLILQAVPPDPEPRTVPGDAEDWSGLEPGWLERLQRFQRNLLREEQPRLVLEALAREFQRVTQAQLVAVGLSGPNGARWEVMQGEADSSEMREALDDAAHRAHPDDSDVQTWHSGSEGPSITPSLKVCQLFPVKGRISVLGHVFLCWKQAVTLSASVQRYLGLLTTHTGLVWDNYHLASLRVVQKELEQELRRARQIQVHLFPPTFDVDPRLHAYAVNMPSVLVSGDYYDLFRTGPDTVAFVIADAMGHGVPAALLMAAVRAGLRLGITTGMTWERVFAGLDDLIFQARTGAFVTGLIGEIDLKQNLLKLVVAGHPGPSILTDGVSITPPQRCRTRPWGMSFDCPWEVFVQPLGKEWSILCFTDGVLDAAARHDRGFGVQVVGDYHGRQGQASAEDLCEGLLSELSARQPANTPLHDDQTLLAIRSV